MRVVWIGRPSMQLVIEGVQARTTGALQEFSWHMSSQCSLVASLLLVVWPGAPSSFLLLVAMPFAPSSVLAHAFCESI